LRACFDRLIDPDLLREGETEIDDRCQKGEKDRRGEAELYGRHAPAVARERADPYRHGRNAAASQPADGRLYEDMIHGRQNITRPPRVGAC
jgi:hypothetical protein